jgi:hypothetical protein
MWKYNSNIDYSKYYHKNTIVFIYYITNNEEIVQYNRYGKFIEITEPKKQTNYESTVIIITNDGIINSITTGIIKFIKIDISHITKKNYQLLKNLIVKNTNNDIYNQIYDFLTHDYIDI